MTTARFGSWTGTEIKTVLIKQTRVREPKWVYAGKSRFLSVDPAGKKKAQWGKIKAAGGNENSPAAQESSPDEE
ncbi:MAG: hypothetical protein OXT69_10680 [Candidatus Poribacteria bacterium]|nr:hypothetical protein [Candidatus Poribacteria bacterium]